MGKARKDKDLAVETLQSEIESLRAQLEESQETLRAIREGEVDALVVKGPEGDRVYTLQGAEHSYRVLIEQMQEGAVTLLADGTIRYCNRQFAEMLRRPLEKVMGTPVSACIDEPDRPAVEAMVRQALAGSARGDVHLCSSDGGLIPVHLALSMLVDGGEPGVCMVVTDLTERRRAEEILASEQFTRRLIESAPIGIAVIGRDLRYIVANPAYQAIAGDAATSIARRSIAEVWPPEVARMIQPLVEQTLQTGEPVEFREHEAPIRGRSWWNISQIPLRTAAGKLEAVLILTQDVTEQKQAEESLRQSEQRLRTMVDAISQLAWMATADGWIYWYNRRWFEYTGTTPQQMEGWGWQSVHDPKTLPQVMEQWKASLATGEPFNMTFPLRRADGVFRPFLTRAVPLRDEHGEVVQWVGTNTDVSEQKAIEEALAAAKLSAEHAKAVAEQANKAKDHFMAVLSHELRTPLSAVIPALDMLAAKVSGEDAENLEIARRNVELEARLIDDLLDVTRISRGKIELDRRPIELCTIIRRAAEVCMPDIEARGLHFEIKVEDKPPHWIDGDPARLQQVFWNLIKNAVKFTPAGGCVGVRVRRTDGQGVVEVVDSGHGIEPDHLSLLFNAFEQAERSITRQFGGLGLGLAISKALVELHGGAIAARSEGRGKGATFTVRLPLIAGAGHAPPGLAGAGHALPSPDARAGHAPPLRILLVEDHGDTARMMRRLLRSEGHEVHLAGDVATAMALATAEQFDVLLSDLGLPDGSGHDLLRRLREQGIKLKAIALSGYGMAADVEKSREVGFIEHVTKPVNFETLQQALRRLALRADAP